MGKQIKKRRGRLTELNKTLEIGREILDRLIELRRPANAPNEPPSGSAAVGHKATPYEIMGVTREVTPEELKKARRYLARHYHSDTGSGSDTMMKAINDACDEIMKEKGWR